MKKNWYLLVIALLIVFNFLLLYQNIKLKRNPSDSQPKFENYLKELHLPNAGVIDIQSKEMNLIDLVKNNKYTLLIFFSPTDCPACFNEKELWQAVPARAKLKVLGIASSPEMKEFWQWVKNSGISIPVLLDTTYQIVDTLGLKVSPLKVLVNSSGEIFWADPPRITEEERNRFWKDLRSVLKKVH